MLQYFPYDRSVFASGAIRSEADLKFCINADSDSNIFSVPLRLKDCYHNLVNPGNSQNFVLTWNREIRKKPEENQQCLSARKARLEARTARIMKTLEIIESFQFCLNNFGHQLWFYDQASFF